MGLKAKCTKMIRLSVKKKKKEKNLWDLEVGKEFLDWTLK